MKLKILFFPLTLIICIVVFIWYIKPEFVNIKNNSASLKNKEKELADIIEKEKNVSDLIANLDSQPEKEKLVLGYLPPYERQEKIIDLLNFLANESLLAVSNINVQKDSLAKTNKGNSGGGEPAAASDINMPPVSSAPASVSIAGSYENIKNYLGYIFSFGRMNNIESVSISKVPAEGSESEGDESESGSGGETGVLKADIGIKFHYAAPVASVNDFNSPVFSLSEFNFSVTDDLNKAIEGGKIVPGIVIDVKGRSNPFSSP